MPFISFKKRLRVYLRDQFECVYCKIPMSPLSDIITLDHVDPNIGPNDENLVTCCKRCNQSKGKNSSDNFLAKIRLKKDVNEEIKLKSIPGVYRERVEILKGIASAHGITYDDLIGSSRKKYIVGARTEAIKQLRKDGLSLSEIARLLGDKDHTTIMYHLKKHLT